MTGPGRPEVTLSTLHRDLTALHEDLTAGFGEMQTAFADLKTTLVAGFRSLPSRESADEMVRLLRESNRLQEERFTQLDIRIREQHLEVLQILHAVVEGQRQLVEGQRQLVEGQRSLSADIRALIARIDALIKGRRDGDSTA
jgi:ABC-type cobalamin/Fe3+-siderophores transport system ATPase subunit